MPDIAAKLARLHERIATVAAGAGRDARDIRLIAVSKTHPAAAIAAAAQAGQRLFGESTIQEALTKMPALQTHALEWHFIGHLQSNKARFIPGRFQWLHSLDNLRLAQRLGQQMQREQTHLNVLIEINLSSDPGRHGIAATELSPLLEQLLRAELPALRLRGLMTVGPHPATETERRTAFAGLCRLRDEAAARYALPGFTELSMGMSGDFEEAIREGSTLLRIGSAIFGQRDYPLRRS